MKRWSITAAEDVPGGAPGESAQGRATAERQVLYWYDPMRPDVHFDEPGKSPFMDMQLVAKYADEEASAEGIVSIDPPWASARRRSSGAE
jgi:Cu(I)/Ag(I) efflux system membrane fusion protein